MPFAAPIWLFGLIPWALLTAWLLLGRHTPAGVPFLPLWDAPADRPRARASARFHLPPAAVLLALLSLLLALLAAAGLRPAYPSGRRLTIILDRGLTMSARPADHPHFLTAAERAAGGIPPSSQIELVDPIDHTRHTLSGSDWLDAVHTLKRTAVTAPSAVADATRDELTRSTAPILILTDHPLPITDARVSVLGPPMTIEDVGIIALVARDRPAAQVMVTLRTHRRSATSVTLTVTGGSAIATRHLDLPPAGDVNAFLDLPTLTDVIEARLSPAPADDLPANDTAWLVRSGESPQLELRSPAVPEAVRRFADVYAKTRPPSPRPPIVAIAADQADLANEAGVIVPPSTTPTPRGEVRVNANPLTRVVDWNRALSHTTLASNAPRGEGWTPLVSIGGRPVLANRQTPAPQLWVGFDQTAWAKSPDFVVFWANAFDWLAGPAVRWTSESATLLAPQWKPLTPIPADAQPNAWPGLYRDDQGRTLAMNAAPIAFEDLRANDTRTAQLAPADTRTWARELLLAAMLCVFLAMLTWRGS